MLATFLVDATALLEIGRIQSLLPQLDLGLRRAQSAAGVAAAGLLVLALASIVVARAGPRRQSAAGVETWDRWRAVRWSAYLTIALLAAVWMLWNYRVDAVLTWPDTEDYAMVAGLSPFSAAFWAGGNPPGLPLVFKAFGLTYEALRGPSFDLIGRRVTQFDTVVSFLATGLLAYSLATVLRHKWLRPVAVLVIFAFGLSMEIAQWNKMLLSESLSTSLFFALVAGAMLLAREWERSEGPRRPFLLFLLAGVALGCALFAFTRDVNAYFLLALGLALSPFALAAAFRRSTRWWVLAVVTAVALLAGLTSVTARRSRWSYPFINLVYERFLPDPAAVAFFADRGFPFDVIETIQPKSRRELHVAFRSDPRAEPLRLWFAEKARAVHAAFLLSRPVETLSAPVSRLATWLSPDVSWYRIRQHPEPDWMLVAGAMAYPESPWFLAPWFVVTIMCTVIWIRAGRGRTVWAVPLLVLAMLYPLLLVVWHGDSAALERHSLPIGLGLRLSLWLLFFLLLDAVLPVPRHAKMTPSSSGSESDPLKTESR